MYNGEDMERLGAEMVRREVDAKVKEIRDKMLEDQANMPAGTSESKARFEELQTQIKAGQVENEKLSEANLQL